jgi:hypothetical protein
MQSVVQFQLAHQRLRKFLNQANTTTPSSNLPNATLVTHRYLVKSQSHSTDKYSPVSSTQKSITPLLILKMSAIESANTYPEWVPYKLVPTLTVLVMLSSEKVSLSSLPTETTIKSHLVRNSPFYYHEPFTYS